MTKVYDNSGSISKNTRKEKDSHPDIKGKATIGGVDYWVDGWQKEGENGKWYSLSFKPKEGARKQTKHVPDPDPGNGDGMDAMDIPF